MAPLGLDNVPCVVGIIRAIVIRIRPPSAAAFADAGPPTPRARAFARRRRGHRVDRRTDDRVRQHRRFGGTFFVVIVVGRGGGVSFFGRNLRRGQSIKTAFSVATFFPQLPWLFLIFLPRADATKKLLGGYGKRRGSIVYPALKSSILSRERQDVPICSRNVSTNSLIPVPALPFCRGCHALLPRAFLHSDGLDRPAGRDRTHGGIRGRVRPQR